MAFLFFTFRRSPLPLPQYAEVVVTYHKVGLYPEENAFVITYENGNEILNIAQGTLSATSSWEFTVDCTPAVPENLVAETTGTSTIALTWDAIENEYDCEYGDEEHKIVIYEALYGDNLKWARPYDMFNSLVDREKYPDVEQEYRFQYIED